MAYYMIEGGHIRKTEKYRGPPAEKNTEDKYPVGPALMALFLFVVCGSAPPMTTLLQSWCPTIGPSVNAIAYSYSRVIHVSESPHTFAFSV
ncbi:hypothetical protein RRG08_005791 [Elysia crispata]|uniref:Uncharacterized protein n=1 Tax=Elysia crispata TaxID=231223 RepID=A0AAE0ZV58_9GAST|nr:hypothetical protein RRG08_005791 [Elysia crispata]